MSKQNIELKPCPFCGSPAYEPELCSKEGARKQYKIGCNIWCVSIIRPTIERCVRDWNTRYAPKPGDKCVVT